MKKKILAVLLVLVTVMALAAPAPALAAKPTTFEANGIVLGILPTDQEFAAGNSGRWVVHERYLYTYLVGPDIAGLGVLTYHANVTLAFQEGAIQGTLVVGGYELNVTGKTTFDVGVDSSGIPGPMLRINGNWNFVSGAKGTGKFSAYVFLQLDGDGHIIGFGESNLSLTGQWQP